MATLEPSTDFRIDDYAKTLKTTLFMDEFLPDRKRDGQVRPAKEGRPRCGRMGRMVCAAAGHESGFLVQQNSLRDAILAALNLNIFARHADRVRMANIAQMINVLQAMIFTDKEKMVLTPTYYVFKMYLPFQDAAFVPVLSMLARTRTEDHLAARGCYLQLRTRREVLARNHQP